MTAVQDDGTVSPQFAHAVRGYDRFQVDEYVERLNEWATGAQARAVEAERLAAERAEELRRLQGRLKELEADRPATPEQAVREAAERAAAAMGDALRAADEIRKNAEEDARRRLEDAGRQAAEQVEVARRSMAGLSEEAAKERRQAAVRVEALVGEAPADAERILAEARTRAEQIVGEAEAAADDARRRSDEEIRRASGSLDRLRAERAEIVGELGRLRGAIQELIAAPAPTGQDHDAPTMVIGAAPDGGAGAAPGVAPAAPDA